MCPETSKKLIHTTSATETTASASITKSVHSAGGLRG
ncbi:Uncharacterised protein [Mycobacteroides abscessus subsp. abscessus]|nr:Uncharacterised protein [Mycobacteroides abscessus subsp. abscessus]